MFHPHGALGGPGVIRRMVSQGNDGSWPVEEKQGKGARREGRWALGTCNVPGPGLAASI